MSLVLTVLIDSDRLSDKDPCLVRRPPEVEDHAMSDTRCGCRRERRRRTYGWDLPVRQLRRGGLARAPLQGGSV
jgi:hypothetical protein